MTEGRQLRYRLSWSLAAGALVAVCGAGYFLLAARPAAQPRMTLMPKPPEASTEDVRRLCGACHAYSPAETFPRSAWRKEVKQGYDFFHKDPTIRIPYPSLESVVRYYESRAPEVLPLLVTDAARHPPPVRFERIGFRPPRAAGPPGVSHVSLVHLFRQDRLDILVCDALNNQVLVLRPYDSPPSWHVLAKGLCCAHAEVVDLDGDGVNDVVLACLGSFYATDDRVGSVVWLKGAADGTFTPFTLLDGIGRVADVRAADFTDDGKLDLVAAVFGWRQTGEIVLLENCTTDWSRPAFASRVLDERHGASHVPIADLNGDGKPDFVALISQEHETVVAFLNEGGGKFRKETIWAAPHPAFGCNGIQFVDLDGDGDLDVLLTNGDALDAPYLLKPYHGVQWLENRGTYPFVPHRLIDSYGAGSAVAADVDGDGDLDVIFVSFLPAEYFPQRRQTQLGSVVWLEQTAPGRFVRHALEVEACDHLSCAVGDVFGDGRRCLVVGNFIKGGRAADAVTVFRPGN